jgi:hypothetical protein
MRRTESAVAGDRTRRHIAREAIAAIALTGLLALARPAVAQSTRDHDNGGSDPWDNVPRLVGSLNVPWQDATVRLVVWILCIGASDAA